eukprot:scaffold42824_cov48-Phaeocystis_antarctica.AAC.1
MVMDVSATLVASTTLVVSIAIVSGAMVSVVAIVSRLVGGEHDLGRAATLGRSVEDALLVRVRVRARAGVRVRVSQLGVTHLLLGRERAVQRQHLVRDRSRAEAAPTRAASHRPSLAERAAHCAPD